MLHTVFSSFSFNILWLAGHHLTTGKNNKAVNGIVDKKIILKNIFYQKVWSFILSFLYISFYMYVYIFFNQ